MNRTTFLTTTLPLSLLGVLLVLMLFTVFTQATSYGLSFDEGLQTSYGLSVYKWYRTLGKDQSFLHYPQDEYNPEHGVIFDAVVAGISQETHNKWATEAISIGIAGVLGVVAIGLCGFELGGWWFAFLAALSLWLYPRFFGAIFNNSKDIPFASANAFLLWSVLLLMKQWGKRAKDPRNSLLVAFFLALTVAIRVNGILWYAILVLLLAGWWLCNFRRVRQEKQLLRTVRRHVVVSVTIGVLSFLGIMVMWPYVFINPFANLYNSIVVNARYPWNGSVLYQGQIQLAANLPRSYAPVWLLIGSPPTLILFAIIGFLLLCAWCVRKKALDPQMIVVTLAFVLPLGLIVGLHAVLYNALRQFVFLVPPLILLAVYGFMRIFTFLWQRKQKVLMIALILLTVLNFAWITKDMLELHPYEYVYFSPLVGGVQGAYGQYEMDYWNTCDKQAAEWLTQHYQQYTTNQNPTIQASVVAFQYMEYLPRNFRTIAENPNFLIDSGTFSSPQQLAQYRLIHTVSVEKVPFCRVYVNTSA